MKDVLQEYRNYRDIDGINRRVRADVRGFIAECEAEYIAKLDAAANRIAEKRVGVLLLAGPSSAGKTTSANRLGMRLARLGIAMETVSMDDYFKTIDRTETDVDYEAPERLDIELLCEHIRILAKGGTVELPKYDFITQRSGMSGRTLSRRKDTVVVFEGIHALSPLFDPEGEEIRIYVSPRMRVTQDNRVYLTAEALRFMRRCARDIRFRGASFSHTLELWPNVIRGERAYVIPSKANADIIVDTSLAYEPGLMAAAVGEGLHALDREALAQVGLDTLPDRADEFEPVDFSLVPADSLMREFIGYEGL